MATRTEVNKNSFAYKEFMAKVRELGGWIEGEKVRFHTPHAARKFEDWLADCNA